MDSYVLFNIFEGIFWIGLGIQAWILSKMLGKDFYKITIFAATTFILFGISDFFEMKQGQLFGVWWLMAWKVVCLAGFVVLLGWYLRLRLRIAAEPSAPSTFSWQRGGEVRDEYVFQCPACKMSYKDKKWADACFAWCKEHHSCNLEIMEHAVKL
jgi:hypothetical protein